MNVYRAVIWFSVLVIIGEGLIISEFNFYPLRGAVNTTGSVLGETTTSLLDEIEAHPFPASYYSEENLQLRVSPVASEDEGDSIIVEADTAQSDAADDLGIDTSTIVPEDMTVLPETPDDEVTRMVEALNSVTGGGSAASANTTESLVKELINKNKRFYLLDLKKELDIIQESLDY